MFGWIKRWFRSAESPSNSCELYGYDYVILPVPDRVPLAEYFLMANHRTGDVVGGVKITRTELYGLGPNAVGIRYFSGDLRLPDAITKAKGEA